MKTYYEYDSDKIYNGVSKEITTYDTWPKNSTFVQPPHEEICQWNGSEWLVLEGKPIESLRESVSKKLIESCNSDFEKLKTGYPERETQSWAVQLSEAQLYLLDNTSPTPFITSALEDGETVLDYCNLIITNNALWSSFAGGVVKKRRHYEKRIESATTETELLTIIEELNSEE